MNGVPTRQAAFFDLDKTIIATSSAAAFTRPFYSRGLISRSTVLSSAYAQFVYLIGSADHDQTERLRQHVSAMSTGWDVKQIKEIVAETLHEYIDPHVYIEAIDLIAAHHAAGRDVVVVSASGKEVVEPIGRMLGADHIVATRMQIEDGRYTGEIEYYAYGEAKAEAIRELAEKHGYDLSKSYAYSDSITDVPMLSAVGHPFAVNADKALRKIAVEHDWGILDFHKPTSLRSRFGGPRPYLVAGGVALFALVVLGIILAARRAQRRSARA